MNSSFIIFLTAKRNCPSEAMQNVPFDSIGKRPFIDLDIVTEVCSFGQKQLAVKWNDCHYHVWHFSSVFALNVSQHQTPTKLAEMLKTNFPSYFSGTCKCMGTLNEFSIWGGSKWQMSAVPKFELNLQICAARRERSTSHQFEAGSAWLYLIKYGARSFSKLWLPF